VTFQAWSSLLGQVMALSLLSVGGALTVAPELHRLLVEELGLLGSSQFTTSIALAQAAPGPNALFAAVLGYQLAGILGAVLVLAAFVAPTTALALIVARVGSGARPHPAVTALKVGLAPISIAMLVATSWILVAPTSAPAPIAVAVAAALLAWRTRLHLLWMIGAGALLGALGVL
jgi:chromate transporter